MKMKLLLLKFIEMKAGFLKKCFLFYLFKND